MDGFKRNLEFELPFTGSFLSSSDPRWRLARISLTTSLFLIESKVSSTYWNEVSKTLVEASSLCSSALGLDCSLWDDRVDWAFLEHHSFGEHPEVEFDMKTPRQTPP